jgi:hypothetical protein
VKGERTPWDLKEFSDTDSDVSNDDLQGDTELKQLLASIATFVTSLFRLSMAIRDPAPTNQSTRTISADKSYFEPHDILHVQAKYPDAAGYLSERLGRAISARRQYLSYREEHHQKLAKHVEKVGFEEPTTGELPKTMWSCIANMEQSIRATARRQHVCLKAIVKTVRTSSMKMTGHHKLLLRRRLTHLSEYPRYRKRRSMENSVSDSMGKLFFIQISTDYVPHGSTDECPLCFVIISIHDKHAWKQHVFRDLHPYSCTFPHCTTADRL